MKKLAIKGAFIVGCLLLSGKLPAQDRTYSITFNNQQLSAALSLLEQQTGYQFFFKESWMQNQTVTASFSNETIQGILDTILSDAKIQYVILDSKIVLTNNTPIITELQTEGPSAGNQYLFAREFEESEESVKILGDRSQMKVGGESLVVGFVKNFSNDEPIVGAVVYTENPEISTVTDANGFYTINLPNGENEIKVRYTGMKLAKQKVILFSEGNLNINMEVEATLLEEITVTAFQDANVKSTKMGVSTLEMESLKNVPKVLGENDVVQVALTLPGVQNVGEGSAGINVRGGKTDQNLMLFNNATVYNPFHFFGFFSAFNADIMGETELYKNSIPANYGGRLSSLLDVKMKVADKEKFHGKGGISPVTSQLSFEVPIIKGKTSFATGVRTTYSDWILDRVNNENIRNADPSFIDVAGNLHHQYGTNSSITVTGYYSRDEFRITTDSLYSYFNFNTGIDWKHFFSDKLAVQLIANTSQYAFDIDYDVFPESAFNYGFEIEERFGQFNVNYFPNDQHDVLVGADVRLYDLKPGFFRRLGETSLVEEEEINPEKGRETSIFISDNFSITDNLTLYAGLRYSIFTALGGRPVNFYSPDAPRTENTITSTVDFDEGENIATFHGPETRISMRYALDNTSSIKAAYNRTRQYIHALSNNISISPTDTWKLSDSNFAPQLSQQFSAGYFKNFRGNAIETSAEIYFKTFENLVDYKVGADLVLNPLIETDVLQGEGRAWGLELLARKNTGKLTGWIAYTYSRSQQRFDSQFSEERINGGEFFPTNFEKPHDISLVSNYKHTRRYSFSLNMAYSTGRPITYPTAKYQLSGTEIVHFSERNKFRIPDYFRVDISVNIEGSHRVKKLGHSYWSFSIYNVTARRNVYSIFFTNNNGTIEAFELSVLGTAIPSISYNFKF